MFGNLLLFIAYDSYHSTLSNYFHENKFFFNPKTWKTFNMVFSKPFKSFIITCPCTHIICVVLSPINIIVTFECLIVDENILKNQNIYFVKLQYWHVVWGWFPFHHHGNKIKVVVWHGNVGLFIIIRSNICCHSFLTILNQMLKFFAIRTFGFLVWKWLRTWCTIFWSKRVIKISHVWFLISFFLW